MPSHYERDLPGKGFNRDGFSHYPSRDYQNPWRGFSRKCNGWVAERWQLQRIMEGHRVGYPWDQEEGDGVRVAGCVHQYEKESYDRKYRGIERGGNNRNGDSRWLTKRPQKGNPKTIFRLRGPNGHRDNERKSLKSTYRREGESRDYGRRMSLEVWPHNSGAERTYSLV